MIVWNQNPNEAVLFYMARTDVLDNFSACGVTYKGDYYPTAEHAYQAAKFDQEELCKRIREASSPYAAKSLAHEACHKQHKRKDWDDVKVSIMLQILTAKIEQHDVVKHALLATKALQIVENSPTDSFWGRGKDWNGLNMLGRLWMALRDFYRTNAESVNVRSFETLTHEWFSGKHPTHDGRFITF